MNLVPHMLRPKIQAPDGSLDDLFEQARELGRIYLYTGDDGNYSVTIKFNTPDHTQLEASSGFDNKTPHEAFGKAIIKARQIRSAFK